MYGEDLLALDQVFLRWHGRNGVMRHAHVSKPAAAAASAAPTCNYYLNRMREVRDALDVGKFGEFVAKFHADRARGG